MFALGLAALAACQYHLPSARDPVSSSPPSCTNGKQDGDETEVDCGGSCSPCVWAFVQPSRQALQSASRRVFARWNNYPISQDNLAPDADYYAARLSPKGQESGPGYGSFMRERPLARPRRRESNWQRLDLEVDVRLASALGLDGFVVDMYTTTDSAALTSWTTLLDAAAATDPHFKIVPAFDMGVLGDTPDAALTQALYDLVRRLQNSSALLALPDGRIVIGVYGADRKPTAFWQQLAAKLEQNQVRVFWWFGVFVGDLVSISAYAALGGAVGRYNIETPWDGTIAAQRAAEARAQGALWVQAIQLQRLYPADPAGPSFVETRNSTALRTSAAGAIGLPADWLEIASWNNYRYGNAVRPSTGQQWATYDLFAYYIAWFKTGAPPPIVRDVLYYSHRIHSTSAKPLAPQQRLFRQSGYEAGVESDMIELVAFLKTPGRLEIVRGADVQRHEASAGLTTFKVPLLPGRPRFRLVRNEQVVIDLESAFDIRERIEDQDLLYRSGGSARAALGATEPCTPLCERGDSEACLACTGEPVWLIANPPIVHQDAL